MLKLLVVEDDPIIRNLLTRRLNREGFQIITARNGVQAVALARAEQPALILLDVDLPILNGWQTTRRLRALPETLRTPIIVLSEAVRKGVVMAVTRTIRVHLGYESPNLSNRPQ